jgi:protein PhnA
VICNQGVTGSSPVIGTILEPGMEVKHSNGNVLKDGDSVILIKDLKVKGAGTTLKRGTKISSIRLTDNEDEVDCRHDKIKGLVLRVEFLKKA